MESEIPSMFKNLLDRQNSTVFLKKTSMCVIRNITINRNAGKNRPHIRKIVGIGANLFEYIIIIIQIAFT